jgi:hypothetical protein
VNTTDLDCNRANSRDHIKGPPEDTIIRQRWVIFPYSGGILDGGNSSDAAHHGNVGNVDNMAKTTTNGD